MNIQETMEAIQVLEMIQATSSNKGKERLLEEYKDNQSLRYLLITALDPFIQTHIKKVKKHNYNTKGFIQPVSKFKEIVDYAINQKARSDELVNLVDDFLDKCGREGFWYEGVITKSLKIGVGAKTLNKVWGVKIFEPNLMKAYDISKIDTNKVKFPIAVEEKLDGVRCLIIHNQKGQFAFTYNGRQIDLPEIFEEIKKLPYGEYDGELLANIRQKTAGIVNKVIKGTSTKDDRENLEFWIFDRISDDALIDRRIKLEADFCAIQYDFKKLWLLPQYTMDNWSQIHHLFKQVRKKNGEGLVLKKLNGKYEKKRSKNWIKYKGLYSTTLKIVDCEEGTGKYKGKIGTIICETDRGEFQIKVGSGLTDEIRNIPCNKLKGKLVEVLYTDFYEYDDKWIMDFPRFKEFRLDKDRADRIDDIEITKRA